jgi:hypothetical protein
MTSEISYRVVRCVISVSERSVGGCPVGEFADHAAAFNAIIADHAEQVPGGELFWTRPNWTAVNSTPPITWCIAQMKDGKPQFEARGPLEFEMQ